MIPTIPTQYALRLAADRQRELESRAARRRLVHRLAAIDCESRRIDALSTGLRRIIATIPVRYRRPVAPAATGPAGCCAA